MMGPLRQAILPLAAATIALGGCGGQGSGSGALPASTFDSDRAFADARAQVDLGPRPSGSAGNSRLTALLADRLRDAGADDVQIQGPYANVVATIPGREPGFVVLGAHHDTVDIPGFVGANDGASGVAVALELARTLPRPLPGPSVAIALFDAEEARPGRSFTADGTRGSRQYVRYAKDGGAQGSPPLEQIHAMVLLDMVGDCDLAIPREDASDEGLYGLFADAAGGAPFSGRTGVILDDHIPFIQAGVPALDLIDFDYGSGAAPGDYWHTRQDTLERICPASLGAVGAAAGKAIPQIG